MEPFMIKLVVKSLTVEGAVVEGKTLGGISIFEGSLLLSFVFQPEQVANLREIISFHVSKHLSEVLIDQIREQEFLNLKGKTKIGREQAVIFVTKCKVVANNERLEMHLDTTDDTYVLHFDNVCVKHLEREFDSKFYPVAPKGDPVH